MMWHDGWGAGNWLLTIFMMSLFWVFVVAFAIWTARGHHALPTSAPTSAQANPARPNLDAPFAAREIDVEDKARRREPASTER